jgi:transposase
MMGRLSHDQEQFFYSFRLDEAVSDDHPVREIAAVLDLSWVHSELAPRLGRPSIDPVLMIRMLIVGYVFAIRSERALCRDVRVNLARLRLRGPRGAQFEFTLAAIAQNLRRLAKLVARPPPLAAPCVA